MGAGTSRDAGADADATDAGAGAGAGLGPNVVPDATDAHADVVTDAGASRDAGTDEAPGSGSGADADAEAAPEPAGSSAAEAAPEPAGPSPASTGSSPVSAEEAEAAVPASTRDVEADFTEPESKGVVSVPGPDGPVRSTRRFPLFTRDTARPEGGGRAAPGDAAAPVRQWPFLAVMGTTAFGLLVVAIDPFDLGFRLGTLLIGLSLIGGAVMRRLIPSVGMLAVRSRFTDMITYGLLGVVISLLALMAQPKPWLEIPFLESVVRFTVR